MAEPVKVERQLQALGLDPEHVRRVIHERWAQYEPLFDAERPWLLFVQGFTEGLMTGALKDRTTSLDQALEWACAIAKEWSRE